MSEVVQKLENATETEANPWTEFQLAKEPSTKIDRWVAKCSEYISPILVKETRQAVKSRQFFWTFFLLIVAAAGWSLLGFSLASVSDDAEYAGRRILQGYWVILGIPLAIIIPFTVFRSLASEYEDDTLQLVSITTMKPYQIILGKLGGAVLQMLIYFSVLAPCICFTYLLRGVDLAQIFFGLVLALVGSTSLSCAGLFLAGVTTSNVARVGLSVFFVLGLFFTYMGYANLMYFVNDGELQGYMLSTLLGTCASLAALGFLAFTTSTSQITFAADNRSTLNRVAMLIVNVVLISMFGLGFAYDFYYMMVWICTLVVFHVWLVFGCLMVGESPYMSPRVRRMLPKSQAGKSFLSLLMPGPGRGYLFAMTNIWGWAVTFILFTCFADRFFVIGDTTGGLFTGPERFKACLSVVVNAGFATFFLSTVYLLFMLIWRNRIVLQPAGGLVFGVVIVTVLTISSVLVHYALVQPNMVNQYSGWQVLNWYTTSYEWVDMGLNFNWVPSLLLGIGAFFMAVVCLIHASRELLRAPMAVPERVIRDDQEQLPSYVPPGDSIDNIFAERESAKFAAQESIEREQQ